MNGIDSSIMVYAMDPMTDEHTESRRAILSLQSWAVNPTVIHEVYHALAFKRMISPADARSKLHAFVRDRRTRFLNITKTVSSFSLDLAAEFGLGGRDSLIVGCFLRNGVETMLTHDADLLKLKRVRFRGRQITFADPVSA